MDNSLKKRSEEERQYDDYYIEVYWDIFEDEDDSLGHGTLKITSKSISCVFSEKNGLSPIEYEWVDVTSDKRIAWEYRCKKNNLNNILKELSVFFSYYSLSEKFHNCPDWYRFKINLPNDSLDFNPKKHPEILNKIKKLISPVISESKLDLPKCFYHPSVPVSSELPF